MTYRYQFKHIFYILVCFTIGFGVFSYKQKPLVKVSGNKVKIAVIAPLSGINNKMGINSLKGIKISQQLAPYLENGDLVELVIMDDESNDKKSIEVLIQLVESHQLTAILLLSDNNTVLTIAGIADQYKIPILAVNASHPNITSKSSLLNQFNYDDKFRASVAALFVRDELFLETAAIFTHSDNLHFHYVATEFARQFIAVEGMVTETIDLKNNKEKLITVLESIKLKSPELLFLQIPLEEILEVVLALKELDWNPKIMVGDGVLARILSQSRYSIDLFEGMFATETFHEEMELTKFGEQLKVKINSMGIIQEIFIHALLGMESYAFLLQAINRCSDPLNGQCVNNKIRSTRKFEGIMGYISIDNQGKVHRPLLVNNIKDEKMNLIVKVY